MAVRKQMIDIPFDIPIPVLFDEHFIVFKYSTYSRGCHPYKEIWNPLVGDDSLICGLEESNEHGKYSVAIVFDNCLLKKSLGKFCFIGVNWHLNFFIFKIIVFELLLLARE